MGSFTESLRVFMAENLSPEARSTRLANVARGAVRDLVSSHRASPDYTRYVDGQEGADESAVRPDGVIVYEFHYVADAAEFAIAFLLARCLPSVTGRYLAGFRVAVNGRPATFAQFSKRAVPAGADIVIFNVEPYSRKMDVGLSGTRALKYRTPPGFFDDAARAVRRRFGNSVSAKRLYTVRFPGQYKTAHGGRIVDSPALEIAGL